MDKRIAYRMVLDTETCPMDTTALGCDPYNMMVYDIGWAIVDKRGKVYEARSYVVKDIYEGEKDNMGSVYYKEKLPQYEEDLKSGKRVLATWYEIRKQMREDMALYGVKEVFAHNARFDVAALNNTHRWLTKSKYRWFFPYGTVICDTLKMARQVMGKMKSYQHFCHKNGYITKRGQLRFTAEICYRYLTQDLGFVESHTALEDVMIEKEIMAYCFRQHKKMDRVLYGKKAA